MVNHPRQQPVPSAASLAQYLLPAVSATAADKELNIFVGRHAEQTQLLHWWEQRSERMFCITGEQGCGKTRLVQEFSYQLQTRDVLIGWASCGTLRQGKPYAVMSEILRGLLSQVPAGTRALIPDDLVRDCLLFFPELDPFFSARQHAALAAIDSVQVSGVFSRLLLFLARSFSILLALDDSHLISSATQHMLEHLLNTLDQPQADVRQNVKLVLIGMHDKGESEHSGICLLMDHLLRDGKAMSLHLGNLNRDDIRQWLFLWSGDPHKVNALAEKLYLQTGGNPYYLKETIHTLIFTGSLSTGSQGWEGSVLQGHDPQLPVPSVVRSQLDGRLRRLSMLGMQVIQAAAVIGPVVPLHLLVDMIRRDGQDMLHAIDELLAAGLLAEFMDEDNEEELFRFPCLLYKQAIYEQTTQVRKSVLEKRMVRIAQEDRSGHRLL
jgi:predicted ATPase